MLNSQLDEHGEFIEAVATGTKETLALFPNKKRLEVRDGVEVWLVSFKDIQFPVQPQPRRQHWAGNQDYLNR